MAFFYILAFAAGPVYWLHRRKVGLTSVAFMSNLTNNKSITDYMLRYRYGLYYGCLFIFIFGALAMISISIIGYDAIIEEYYRVLNAAATGKVDVVEGQVQNFVAYSPNGEEIDAGEEKFIVNGIAFSFAPKLETATYHRSVQDGGFIRPGSWVRLYYVNDIGVKKIIKIEIRKDN